MSSACTAELNTTSTGSSSAAQHTVILCCCSILLLATAPKACLHGAVHFKLKSAWQEQHSPHKL